jgi:hypothetical protein
VLTRHDHDLRANVYAWRWRDGELVEVVERREHWVATARARKRR